MLRTLANDTIGTGPALQCQSGSRDADTELEMRFWEWSQAIDLPRKLRLMRESKARDGEVFASLRTNPRLRVPVQLDILLHESEMVAEPAMSLNVSSLTDGIILDDFGNPLAYRLLLEHPGERVLSMGGLQAETIPARDMIHLFHSTRPGAARGIPEIMSALPLYAQLRRYTLAVIRCAESAALMTWMLKTQQSPVDPSSAEPFDTIETERGMGMVMPDGWEMQQLKAEQPTDTYPGFKKEIIAEIARCLNMPFNVAAGDSSGYNYSSGRLDHRSYYKSLTVERGELERVALNRVFSRWFAEARLISRYLPDQFFRGDEPRHDWRWPGDEHVDPTKEADATETRIAIGISSYPDECAKLGNDYEMVHAKNASALGLTVEAYRARLADRLLGPVAMPPQAPAKPQADSEDPEEGADDGE
jgi:lambda family phage portal protein